INLIVDCVRLGCARTWFHSGVLSLPGRDSPRRARHLFFASPKKSTQKKGDPQSGSLRCAMGNLRCSEETEISETCLLRSLRTAEIFIRPLLRCSAQPGRV